MILNWFDAKEAKEFGVSLGMFYMTQLPLDVKKLDDKKFAARTQNALRQVSTRVEAFMANKRLNGYKKAQLGNAFKWALRDAGYDAQYVDQLTEWLLTRL